MHDDFLLVGLISLVISIILIWTFMNISGNIRKIRVLAEQSVLGNSDHGIFEQRVDYYTYKSIPGHENQQVYALTRIIYTQLLDKSIGVTERAKRYENLKAKYGAIFDSLGRPFPPDVEHTANN